MSQANAEAQVALFDYYVKLDNLVPIKVELESIYQRKSDEPVKGADQYDVLKDALDALKLSPTERCSPGRWRAAAMPIMNPLLMFNSLDYFRERNPEGFKSVTRYFELQNQPGISLTDIAGETGCFADFQTLTGRTIKAYATAYKTNTHSHFGRLSRHLRKNGWANNTDSELMLYLAHPVMRYDARQRFLEGKQVPLLEVDLLKTWANRYGIALPEQVPSYASQTEGERDADGTINEARSDGARLTRQQVLDQCKALLPDVLDFLNQDAISGGPESRDHARAISGVMALFAVASLHDDPAIMRIPETFVPSATLALQRMSGEKRVETTEESFDQNANFFLGHINDGFYPSVASLAEKMVDEADDWTAQAPDADTSLPGTTYLYSPDGNESLRVAQQHAQPLSPTALLYLQRSAGVSTHVTPLTDIKADATALTDAIETWEATVHEGVYQRQRFHLLVDSKVDLPEKPVSGDSLLSLAQMLFVNALPIAREYGADCIDMVGLLQQIVQKYVTMPTNEDVIADQVTPTMTRMTERLLDARRGFFFQEESADGAETLMIPVSLADSLTTTLPNLRGRELRDVAQAARWVGMQFRYAHTGAMHLAFDLYREAEAKQAAVTEAAANVQPSATSAGANTFQEIETQMAAMDEAREDYRQWAEGALARLMPFVKTLDALLKTPLTRIPLNDDTAQEGDVDPAPEADAKPRETTADIADRAANLEEQLAAVVREKGRVERINDDLQQDAAKQAAEVDRYVEENTYLQTQNQALTHHLNEAKTGAEATLSHDATAIRDAAARHLADFNHSPTPRVALKLAQALYPDKLIFLDSAFASADDASTSVGTNILRRLLLLATEGVRIMQEGNPLYALNNIIPGDVACSESDTSLNIPKLRQEREFREVLTDGSTRTWLMTAHNWINYGHRLYFEYDNTREAFVIGHAGRHLQVISS